MEEKNSGGIGLLSILTIIFVIAKLFGVIDWSWWLVFAPTIVSVAIGLLVVVIALIVAYFID
ncbi:MAG: hypothetical protein L0J48_02210 [Alkalibacterium sp.]|nr:hypothetical protein [Alkalibacterium sp.]